MRCPTCGLVHLETDVWCRRCEVDLRTGQPRPVEVAVVAPPAWETALEKFRPLLLKIQPRKRYAAQPRPLPHAAAEGAPAAAPPVDRVELPSPAAPRRDALRKRTRSLAERIRQRLLARSTALRTLTCVQCESAMDIQRLPRYGAAAPTALVSAGAVIFFLGFMAWPLLLLGPAALGLGLFYRRVGTTRWHCRHCGFQIEREA